MHATHEDIGYEAGSIRDGVANAATLRRRDDAGCEAERANLRALCIDAMLGHRRLIPHVEHRIHSEIVAMAPLAEVLAECADTHVVHHALVDLLRDCVSPQAAALRAAFADRYAQKFAPRIAALRGAA